MANQHVMKWRKEVLVSTRQYENVRLCREVDFNIDVIDFEDPDFIEAVLRAEIDLAKDIFNHKPLEIKGKYSNVAEFEKAQELYREEVLKAYGLSHVVPHMEFRQGRV